MKKSFGERIKSFDAWDKVFEIFVSLAGLVLAAIALYINPDNFTIGISIFVCQVIATLAGVIAFCYVRSYKTRMNTAKELHQFEEEKLQDRIEQHEAECRKQRMFLERALAFGADTGNRISSRCPVSGDKEAFYNEYNKFMANLFREQDVIMTDYLRSRGNEKKLSFSLKLFTEIYGKESKIDTAMLFTAFRDKKAYEEGVREVGGKYHSLKANGDFRYCLNQSAYIKNYMSDCSMEIENSNYPACLQFYNAAVVVPIYRGHGTQKKVFGYFCCDTINLDPTAEIFEENTANLMKTAACSIAIFLDNANFCWTGGEEGDILTFLDKKCRENYNSRYM